MSEPLEMSRLAEGGAVAVTGRIGLVWVTGPDAVTFLDGILSQNVAGLAPGATARSLLLAPNGKMRATLFVLRGQDRVGLVCDAGRVNTVIEDLSRFKIRVDVAIAPEPRATYEIWGPPQPGDDVPAIGSWAEEAGRLVFAMPLMRHDLPRAVVIGRAPDSPVLDHHSEITLVRIEAGEPEMGIDLDDRTIPQEGVDVAKYVDFTKGCYLGQELVARIDSRGHVNRRLAGLHIEGEKIPDRASPIEQGGREVGRVTSAAWSVSRERVVALAMLRVELEPGDLVTVGTRPAQVVSLPMSP